MSGRSEVPMAQPNVLFILSDQHNAKVTGYAGHPNVKTPTLDRMANEGVRFDNMVVQNPICTPSRVSYLSGQYCHNHGYYGLSGRNPNGLPSILGHFRRHGYTTAAIGKIHCPEYWIEDDTDLFIETCPGCSIGSSPEYNQFLKDNDAVARFAESTGAKGPNGGGQLLDGLSSPLSYDESQEGYATARMAEFIRAAHEAGKPFCAHLSFPKPHQVYEPAPEFWDLYDEESIELPANADYDMSGKAPNLAAMARGFRDPAWTKFEPRTFEAGRLRKMRGYLGCISHVDHSMSEVFALLEELDILDDTIVVYTADHGDYAVEHGIMEKAPGICSDAITRVPLLVRYPNAAPAGVIRSEVVEAVDITPTLCDLAGVPVMNTVDGASLKPLLSADGACAPGDAASWGKACIPSSASVPYKPTAGLGVTEFPLSTSVRAGQYRMVIYAKDRFPEYPDGFTELYDLAEDPWEMRNLALAPGHEKVIATLTDELMRWRMRTSRFTTALGAFQGDGPEWTHRYKNSTADDGRIGSEDVRSETGEFRGNYL